MAEFASYLQDALNVYPIKFTLTLSLGAAMVDHRQHIPVEIMLDMAEKAQKTVSGNFSKHIAWYDEQMRQRDESERTIVLEMGDALACGQFQMYLQPKSDMNNGKIIGSEALARWKHPVRGMISPASFVPVMENNGFISKLDTYIWEQACICQRKWLDEKREVFPISVNVSRADLYNPKLLEDILSMVDGHSLPHNLIEFEMTESSFVFDNSKVASLVCSLQQNGFRVLMDDFGSGYSSLNTLKDINVDVLKIDLKFLLDSHKNERSERILESVVKMTRMIDLDVIIEGVETPAQVVFLKSIGVSNAQGYHYFKPMPVDEFEKLLK